METGKSKEKQGGSKEWEEKEEDDIQDLCCRPQGAGVAKGTIPPQHGWGCVIHRSKAGHGSPRQQLARIPCLWLFLPSPAECGALLLLKLQLPRLSCHQPAP